MQWIIRALVAHLLAAAGAAGAQAPGEPARPQGLERYAPIPTEQMRPEDRAMLDLARKKRERFLADRSFGYAELEDQVRKLIEASARLDMQGKPQEALAKLREIEQVRLIADIPTPELVGWYSHLLGKNRQLVLQREMRGLLFGTQQAIAHSGDGRSTATAIDVVFIDEEYDVLRDRKLKPIQQAIRETADQKYDVMTVEDAQGRRSEMFFRVTGLYERRFAPVVPLAGFDAVWRDAERQFTAAPARDYLQRYLSGTWVDQGRHRMVQWPGDKGITECVTAMFPGPDRVRMAFQVDAEGVVQQAHTDQTGYVDECVKTKTVGQRVPAPPSAPFFLCTSYEKTGADRTLVSGCGPAPITQDCQRAGNRTTCQVQMR